MKFKKENKKYITNGYEIYGYNKLDTKKKNVYPWFIITGKTTNNAIAGYKSVLKEIFGYSDSELDNSVYHVALISKGG